MTEPQCICSGIPKAIAVPRSAKVAWSQEKPYSINGLRVILFSLSITSYVKGLSFTAYTIDCCRTKLLIGNDTVPVVKCRQRSNVLTPEKIFPNVFLLNADSCPVQAFAELIRPAELRAWVSTARELKSCYRRAPKCRLYNAHCRAFETLHCWFCFIKLMSNRDLFVIALTVTPACSVHYLSIKSTVE